MSLYLLLAIAFGALTGVADVPAARPVLAVAHASERRVKRQAAAARVLLSSRVRAPRPAWRLVTLLTRRADVPLTGAASPRAPSRNC